MIHIKIEPESGSSSPSTSSSSSASASASASTSTSTSTSTSASSSTPVADSQPRKSSSSSVTVARRQLNQIHGQSQSTNAPSLKPKRGQANKRERVRTENVNAGFDSLRELIPTDPRDRKLSKIEVLRLATSYIHHLSNLTWANSCLEAKETRYSIQTPSSACGKRPHHVCTFCLMMSKMTLTTMKTQSDSACARPAAFISK